MFNYQSSTETSILRDAYVGGCLLGRGRRPAVASRYHPDLWNHFESALNKSHRTNNASEEIHNRFRIVVGKHHPDLYSALGEFQKEQGFTEVCIAELALGKRVKKAPKKKWVSCKSVFRELLNSRTRMKLIMTFSITSILSETPLY